MNTQRHALSWVETSLYPFESKYVQLEAGKMHYIDQGHGDIILFVHGTPTWSFLYRDFVKDLSQTHRCIAIDHLGFGLSDKVDSFSGTPQAHAQNLKAFIQQLDLQHITLVVHDFGGPIGLAAGIEHSDRIERVVLLNSWLWETKHNADALKIDKLVRGWLGKMLYLNLNFSPKVLLKKGVWNKKNLSKHVHTHYLKPFPNAQSRIPLLVLAKALVGSSDWYQKQWERLDKLIDKEWLILWGTKDEFITTTYLDIWKKRLSHATIREFECGHYVQEEKSAEAISTIRHFIKNQIKSRV